MQRITLTAAMMVAVLACGSDSEPPRGPTTVTISHYDYSFDLITRAATAVLTIEVLADGNCFDLPIRAAGFDAVTIDDVEALARVDAGQLTVCGDGWEAGAQLTVATSGTVAEQTLEDSQVGFSSTLDIEGNPFTYLVSWVGGCDQFGPCQSQPDAFATYTFRVTHPADTEVLCSGDLTTAAGETTCQFGHAGGPTYSTFGLMASPSWTKVDLGTWGSASVTLYDFPTANLAADIDSAVHANFIDFMEENFGPYPYGDTLRLAAGPTYWNGFEHPGNISLSERLNVINSLYANPLEHTINHELAHMWAGDQTTLASTYDFVWKEAMAEYLTYVFTDERKDPTEALRTARAWKQFSAQAVFFPVPAEQPPLLNYYGDVYGPGPLVLFRQIEGLYSREAVMNALRSLLGTERALAVSDIKEALEAEVGVDLTNYFNKWVFGEGAPVRPLFSIAVSDPGDDGTDVTIDVTQENSDLGLFGCAFHVRLVGAGGESHDVSFDLGIDGAASTSQIVTTGFPVTDHVFDPLAECLAFEVAPGTRVQAAPSGPRINPWVVL